MEHSLNGTDQVADLFKVFLHRTRETCQEVRIVNLQVHIYFVERAIKILSVFGNILCPKIHLIFY